ncbi:MAG: YcjX family protein [Gemmataceae bacterium]|nr:YcjX family protein [Gemmataceae bacterium]
MSIFRVKTTECRVGVVGLYNSGKTVLLTSLINHLQDHDHDRFPLGGRDTKLRKFVALPPDDGWEAFPYAAARDALVTGGRWPGKTRDRSQFACRFERSDWRFSDCLLKLYDLPGERIADAAMLGRDFAAWSDHVHGQLAADAGTRAHYGPFLDALGRVDAPEADLLRAYKLGLAHLILNFKPLVSPSAFLLDAKGQPARPDTPEALAEGRFAGLGPGQEFAPLPASVRSARPDLAALFTSRYDEYVDRLVRPAIHALKSCTALVVMVDVTMLLAGGVGMYDDTRLIVRDLLDVLSPGEHPVFGPLARGLSTLLLPHQLRPGWITRLAFAAPKLDLVHPSDRDRMLVLARRMVERYADSRDGLRFEFFNLSSVVSTKPLPVENGRRFLVGVPLRDADGKKVPPGPEQRFGVSGLPDDWPADWRPGEYAFPDVYPRMPPRKDYPPEQINLDRLASFVID